MRQFNILIVFFMMLSACVSQNTPIERTNVPTQDGKYSYFGVQFADANAITGLKMLGNYQIMSKNDTISHTFSGRVTEVCKVKGCWMKLELGNGEEAMVKFKDYAFFVPSKIVGKEVVVKGLAFVEEMGVKDQRHYASDGGKSVEEISRITQVKKNYAFEADGVLIKN